MLPTVNTGELLTHVVIFLPETIVTCTAVLLLLLRVAPGFERAHLGWLTLVALLGAFAYNAYDLVNFFAANTAGDRGGASSVFQGMLVYDKMLLFVRAVLLGAAALTAALCLF